MTEITLIPVLMKEREVDGVIKEGETKVMHS